MYQLQQPFRVRVSDDVAVLTAGWRKTLINALALRGSRFQLAMGTSGLRTDDNSGFFTFADTVPGNHQVSWFKGAAGMRRSAAYLAMLRGLLPVGEFGLRGVLGVHYKDWIQCRNEDLRELPQQVLFRDWAESCLDARLSCAAIRIFNTSLNDPVNRALDAYGSARNRVVYVGRDGRIQRLPLYSGGVQAAHTVLSQPRSGTLSFDSGQQAERLATPQRGASSPRFLNTSFPRFFGVSKPETLALEQKILSAGISISGGISRAGMMRTDPESWCDPYEVDRAWQGGQDRHIWDEAAPDCNWDRFFGPQGGLAQRVESILVVSGVELKLTCKATFSDREAAIFRASAGAGVWPLQSFDGPIRHSQNITHNADNTISVQMQVPENSVQIWGGELLSVPD